MSLLQGRRVSDAAKRGGTRTGAGRPAEAGVRRTRSLHVRTTDEGYDAWEEAAGGAPVAEWARDALDAATVAVSSSPAQQGSRRKG